MKPPNKPTTPLPTFRASSDADVPECFIANPRQSRDVLVAVHGISRNVGEIAMRFAIHPAFSRMTIIAPLFTEERFGRFQELRARHPDQTPADAGLIRLLDKLAPELGITTDRFALFGFGGGAQMAHRFAMFHPQRVSRLCAASADWYSMPRTDLPYPYGIGGNEGAALVGPDFLDIPTTVIVGNRDTRLDAMLRQDDLIVEHQGKNRLRRARCYVRAAHAYADAMGKGGRAQLLTLHGISPDFHQSVLEGDLIGTAAQALL